MRPRTGSNQLRPRACLALAGVFTIGISGALAEFQAVDHFDDRPLGEIAPQPDWSGSAGTGKVELDPSDSQNQVLAVRTNSGLLRRPLSIPDGTAQTLFFRLRFGDQQNYSIGLSPLTNPVEFGDFGAEVGMASAIDKLRVWDGDFDHYKDLAILEPGRWYNVWLYIDTSTDHFEVWANDRACDGAASTDQLDNGGDTQFGFRSGIGSFDLRSLFIKTGGGSSGSGAPDGPVFIDDIYLDTGPGSSNLSNPADRRDGYEEKFESGSPRGWVADNAMELRPSGGVGDSAYLEGRRQDVAPSFFPVTDSAGANLLGNLGRCYGPEIRFSYAGRSFAGTDGPIAHNFFIAPLHETSTYWSKSVAASGGGFLTGWGQVDLFIDTRWSDAEANAHGWSRLRGGDSWSDTLADVGRNEFFKGSGNTGGLRVAGIDNVLVSPSPVPVTGLVAYYPFDGDADDTSGGGNHGTPTGAELTDDAACNPASAYHFDGAGDLIDIPGFPEIPGAGTIAAWVTAESFETGSDQSRLVFGQSDGLQLGLGDSSLGADGLWVFRHNSGGMNTAVGPAPETNKWTHVAGVWTGAEASLYIDGVRVARVASGTTTAAAGAARIGAHPLVPQNFWDGKIDEVLLYDRALTQGEIAALAAAVEYSDEPPRLLSIGTDGPLATLTWQPPLQRATIEFSTDLCSWTTIAGPVSGCSWSGSLPAGNRVRSFLRVRPF